MARVLIADRKRNLNRLSKILSGHELHHTTSRERAREIMEQHEFDLIVCGVHFDDSRMIEFLMDIRRDCNLRDVPFVCWQNECSEIKPSCMQDAMKAAALLGASFCLPYELVSAISDGELRNILEQCLGDEERKEA